MLLQTHKLKAQRSRILVKTQESRSTAIETQGVKAERSRLKTALCRDLREECQNPQTRDLKNQAVRDGHHQDESERVTLMKESRFKTSSKRHIKDNASSISSHAFNLPHVLSRGSRPSNQKRYSESLRISDHLSLLSFRLTQMEWCPFQFRNLFQIFGLGVFVSWISLRHSLTPQSQSHEGGPLEPVFWGPSESCF